MRRQSQSQKRILAVAFLLPVLLMLLLFAIKSIFPFGDKSFLTGDLYHQYMPFFSEALRKIRAGEGLDYSFRVGVGSNFLALFIYYLASPFHLLSLLVPDAFLVEFISYLIVIKTGLCGLTSALYLKEHFHRKDYSVVMFSLLYSFSGFMAAYNYNIMWVDCVWLLPLVILGLERLVKEGHFGLYGVTLTLSILTNFYLSIMVCIFLVLYFVFLFVTERGHRLRSIGLFCLTSLLAGAMAGIYLVPVAMALLQTDFGDISFPTKVESYFSLLDVLARHCVCVQTERGLDHWPNIFCGSMVIFMLPLYLINEEIPVREKFCKTGIAAFILLSFSTNVLDFVWHGLNYPDSLPGRQSFLYCFLIIVMCYDAFQHSRDTNRRQIVFCYLSAVLFLLFCEKFVNQEDFEQGALLLTFLLITLYAVLLYLWSAETSVKAKTGVAVLALLVVMTECCINLWDTGLSVTSRSAYLNPQKEYKALYQVLQSKEEGFARVEKFTRKTKNDSALAGYPSASVFSSTMNSRVMDFYTRLGMRHSKVYYCFDGATAFTAALLNVKYMFGDSQDYENTLYEQIAQSGGATLYRNRYSLPFGYVAPWDYEMPEGYDKKGLLLQNEMVHQLGIAGSLFRKRVSTTTENDISFTAGEEGIYYAILTAGGTTKVTYLGGSTAEEKFSDLKKGCVLYLGQLTEGQTITLTNGDETDETPKIYAEIYQMDENVLEEALELLSRQQMKQVKWENGMITGNLTMTERGKLILSVPMEKGWRIELNGEPVEPGTFGDCFVALNLEPGEYHLEMTYRAAGANAGILLSVCGVAMFAGCLFITVRKKKPEGKKEDEGEENEEI